MTKKGALVVTSLLTVFVLVIMLGVMTRLTAADASANSPSGAVAQAAPQGAQVAPIAQSSAAPVVDAQLAQQREQIYRQRLDEANAQIQKANAQIQQANEQFRQMQAQNTQLLQREQTYQQRLQEANSRLMQPGAQAVAVSQSTQVSPQQTSPQQAATPQQAGIPQPTGQQQALPQLASQQMLSPDQAAAIASQYMGGGRVGEVKLERAHGAVAYEVKVGGGNVAVDAYNGDVLFSKQEKPQVRDLGFSRLKRDGHDRDDD